LPSTLRSTQALWQQSSPMRQMLPQLPQLLWLRLVSTQIPSQFSNGAGQTQEHVTGSFTNGGAQGFGQTHPQVVGSCTWGEGQETGMHSQEQLRSSNQRPAGHALNMQRPWQAIAPLGQQISAPE
jgi:hypothetical protein